MQHNGKRSKIKQIAQAFKPIYQTTKLNKNKQEKIRGKLSKHILLSLFYHILHFFYISDSILCFFHILSF